MAHYIFVVNVRTDDHNVDAPSVAGIRNDIINNLEWNGSEVGIERVTVRHVPNGVPLRLDADVARLPCGHASVTPCLCGWDV